MLHRVRPVPPLLLVLEVAGAKLALKALLVALVQGNRAVAQRHHRALALLLRDGRRLQRLVQLRVRPCLPRLHHHELLLLVLVRDGAGF